MKQNEYPLTYFTNRTKEELDVAIIDLQSCLTKDFKNQNRMVNKIVNLFIEKFDPNNLLSKYKITISDSLEKAIKKTLQYAIDTEILIRHIYDVLNEAG